MSENLRQQKWHSGARVGVQGIRKAGVRTIGNMAGEPQQAARRSQIECRVIRLPPGRVCARRAPRQAEEVVVLGGEREQRGRIRRQREE